MKRSIGGATASVILDLRSLLFQLFAKFNEASTSSGMLPVMYYYNYGCVNLLLAFWFTEILIIYCTDLIVTNTTTVVLLKTGILQN